MRNMSFFHTQQQIRDRTKTVTRRLGWANLRPGDRVCAVVKGQGLNRGEKVQRLGVIEIVANTRVRLNEITQDEVIREGFPDMGPARFVEFFCWSIKCSPNQWVNRIEFRYIDE